MNLSARQRAALLAACLALTGSLADAEPAPAEPINVLLVTLDTTRADHLGCYGADFASTPHLDRLAREGVRFDQAISPAPLTLPSHVTMFTGMVPRRHGVRNNTLFRLGPEPELLPEILRRHGYATAAFVSSAVLDRIVGLDRGFDHYDDSVRIGSREAFNYEERAASQTNQAILERLESLETPFFLWVHYFDPHLPYLPPGSFASRFAERPYDGEIAFMDDQLGRLLEAVRSKAGPLLVVVAGDHGESLGDHGEASHGVFVYQATQRVPFLISGPGVPRGAVATTHVGLVDLAPTLLDLLGLPPLPAVDGRSLLPLLQGKTPEAADYEVESMFPAYVYGWAPLRGLVRDGYKFIDAPRPELYRLATDPGEADNLAPDEVETTAALAASLQSRLVEGANTTVSPDSDLLEHRRRLESLGYVGGGTALPDSSIDPKDGIAWIDDLEAGRRAYQSGRPAEGIAPLRRLLERNPDNVPALLALGVCYLGAGQAQAATASHRRALALRPDDELIEFNLANALAAAAEDDPVALDEARRHYERALEIHPRFADAYLNYAVLLERGGSLEPATVLLERARSAGVADPDIETRIAVLRLRRGEVEAAKEAFRRSLMLHPTAPGPLEALARIHRRQGDLKGAAEYFRRLLRVAPTAGLAAELGAILLKLGDRPGAVRAYEQALELMSIDDPGRQPLRELIEELNEPDPGSG